jgi:glycosyltransferase involved in cell wall biosynthesis
LKQSRCDFELVVVDDGSADQTAIVAKRIRDARVRVISQANAGTASARNAGIAATTAPLIAILDSDDLWLPTYLETMGATLARDEGAALCYTDAWVLDDASGRVRRRSAMASQNPPNQPPSEPRPLLARLLESNFIFVSTTFRRQVVEQIGNFDSRCFCEDYELWLRFAARGYHVARAPGRLAVYRDRNDSKSADDRRGLEGLRGTLELVHDEYPLSSDLRALIERRLAVIDRELSGQIPPLREVPRVLARRFISPYLWYRQLPPEVAAVLSSERAEGRPS